MPRRIVYGISLWVFLGAVALTIASIALPNWVSYTSPTSNGSPIRVTYGLHKRCSSITGTCTPFPLREECHDDERYFCSTWRSAGFFMNFSVVIQLACVIAYVTVLFGGRTVRESGWKILSGLLGVVAASQLVAMALVVSYLDMGDASGGWNCADDLLSRLRCTRTIRDFSSAGSWISRGFCAPSAGLCS
jgi:hypothetical protein